MMSPMSTWLRNWTPLTTRPSRTSRQGMMRRANMRKTPKIQTPNPKQIPMTKHWNFPDLGRVGVFLAFWTFGVWPFSACQCLLQRELLLVQRAADDGAGGAGAAERPEIVERRDAARGLDLQRGEPVHEARVEGG